MKSVWLPFLVLSLVLLASCAKTGGGDTPEMSGALLPSGDSKKGNADSYGGENPEHAFFKPRLDSIYRMAKAAAAGYRLDRLGRATPLLEKPAVFHNLLQNPVMGPAAIAEQWSAWGARIAEVATKDPSEILRVVKSLTDIPGMSPEELALFEGSDAVTHCSSPENGGAKTRMIYLLESTKTKGQYYLDVVLAHELFHYYDWCGKPFPEATLTLLATALVDRGDTYGVTVMSGTRPLVYWDMDDVASARDATGNGNDGDYNGMRRGLTSPLVEWENQAAGCSLDASSSVSRNLAGISSSAYGYAIEFLVMGDGPTGGGNVRITLGDYGVKFTRTESGAHYGIFAEGLSSMLGLKGNPTSAGWRHFGAVILNGAKESRLFLDGVELALDDHLPDYSAWTGAAVNASVATELKVWCRVGQTAPKMKIDELVVTALEPDTNVAAMFESRAAILKKHRPPLE